jgi:hypothetical protein
MRIENSVTRVSAKAQESPLKIRGRVDGEAGVIAASQVEQPRLKYTYRLLGVFSFGIGSLGVGRFRVLFGLERIGFPGGPNAYTLLPVGDIALAALGPGRLRVVVGNFIR